MAKDIWILSKKTIDEYENSRLVEAFKTEKLEVELVHPDNFDLIVNKQEVDIWLNAIKVELPKAVLVRTGSGSDYFSLAVMRQLESLEVPVVNTSSSILRVKDKLETMQLLAANNIPIPKTMLVHWPINEKIVNHEIGFPCVVKVITGSHGKGVYLCNDEKSFGDLMELIHSLDVKKTMIIQEYIGHKVGTDLRVWVIGGKVVGAMQRISNDDFRANISNGGTGMPYPLTEEIEYIAGESARILGLDIAGVDLLFDKDGFKVCETNSSPQFTGLSKYTSIDAASEIVRFMKHKIS